MNIERADPTTQDIHVGISVRRTTVRAVWSRTGRPFITAIYSRNIKIIMVSNGHDWNRKYRIGEMTVTSATLFT